MMKLMKYEFRKTVNTKLILLGITAVAELAYLIFLYNGQEETMIVTAFLLTVLAIGGILVIGLESVVTLHRDMNTRQGYMLFMTPNSCYKILGAKVLECGLSILITGVFFFALGALDITLLFQKYGELNRLVEMIQDLLHSLSFANGELLANIDMKTVALLVLNMLSSWICTITTAYLADVVSAALLNGKAHNGIISFLLFLALSFACGWVGRAVNNVHLATFLLLALDSAVNLALATVMYYVTAQIMEKKLSV